MTGYHMRRAEELAADGNKQTALVHATLALVEQQRIANLIAYVALPMEVHGTESDAWPEINDGLGLT